MEKCVDDEGDMRATITRLHFRPLRADEVDVRPAAGTNSGNKVTLLLYQDARCAMNILDDTVGPQGWQKKYYEAAGMLFCDIGILDPNSKQWLWKSDTGSKSNIEEDKGQASDAFKRAAVAWGIGRELYSAPRITVKLTDKDMFNGKPCQTFKVSEMSVSNGSITSLVIVDKWGDKRFEYPNQGTCSVQLPQSPQCVGSGIQGLVPKGNATNAKQDPHSVLNAWYQQKKQEPTADTEELDKFYAWCLKPDRKKPNLDKTQAAAEDYGVFRPEQLWQGFLKNKKSGRF